jgi:hypothetical protein
VPIVAIVCGIILVPIGWVVYDQTGREHVTALIPVFLGGLLILLGALAFLSGMRKHAMHTAAMVGVIGAIGAGVRALPGLFKWLSSGTVQSLPALVGTSLTTLICLVFVLLCVNSFVQARRRRDQAGQVSP